MRQLLCSYLQSRVQGPSGIKCVAGEVMHWMRLHGLREGLRARHPTHHALDVLNGTHPSPRHCITP